MSLVAENYFGHFGFHITSSDTETATFTISFAFAEGSAKMANCGVKRDLESSYVHFQNSVRSVFSKISIEVFSEQWLQSSLSNGFDFGVRLRRATISGAENNPDSQRMSIKIL